MKRKIIGSIVALVLILGSIAILFSACTSTSLTNVWQDPAYNLGPMKTIIIISINKNAVRRRLWEDTFTLELTKYGVVATPSYRLFPDDLPDTSRIAEAIHLNGYDGILIISKLKSQTQTTTVDPSVTTVAVTHYNPWRARYDTRFEEEINPGYTDTIKIVRHEVDIWSLKENGSMVWSGTCMTADPASSQQVHDETVGLIAPILANAHLLPPKKQP